MARRDDARGMSEALAIAVSAVVGIVVAVASVWYVNGSFDASFETLYRVNPTVEGGGVGADFVAGNTDPLLDALIVVIHAVDVLMGVFILALVFVHWGAFRRLGARMRDHDEPAEVATDGGRDADSGGESA
ncbi:uncharacterized protein HHUB_1883 [Halobacterium hubeiense]|jgi:multisubunit Na+/H+ antiporter MnhB subunit|uniref:Uncharacterized protein n=2 Tax=Halobacterium TaxID=2239 RepID=A0A0U5CWV1_9EURY|nr:hypothetical protein [Halobacterium hubeiense]CQH52754.1 uncharacterized protein HHUB_1883 [Halobacterium hubeiense]